jgi:hypothetical protein
MRKQKKVTLEQARLIGETLYLDWDQVDLEQFRRGLMGVQARSPKNRLAQSNYRGVLLAGKTVMAHMQQFPDYFVRLARLRAETKARYAGQRDAPRRQSA